MQKKILIVDDDAGVRHILSTSIGNLDYLVIQAENGLQALQKIETEKPDLVLLDILMPTMDGYKVMEEVRLKQNNLVPIIILSNFDNPKDVEKGMALGAVDYVIKAKISLKEIMDKIRKVFA